MSRKDDELLFLVRAAYAARRSPREAIEMMRRHLAFRAVAPPPRPLHLALVARSR